MGLCEKRFQVECMLMHAPSLTVRLKHRVCPRSIMALDFDAQRLCGCTLCLCSSPLPSFRWFIPTSADCQDCAVTASVCSTCLAPVNGYTELKY